MPAESARKTLAMPRHRFLRDLHAGQFLDLFLVSAVTSVLVIRFYLHVAGYPKVGGDALHVAHMLWGGLLMLAAIVVLLSLIGRRAQQISALLGGIGFGTFIDEIGKFVTHDNNYFFQPAVAMIYVAFILTYLAIRSVHGGRGPSRAECLANALRGMETMAVRDLDEDERQRVLSYLEKSDPDHPITEPLARLIRGLRVLPPGRGAPWHARLRDRAIRGYRWLAHLPGFPTMVVGFFVAQLVLKSIHLAALVIGPSWSVSLAVGVPRVERVVEGMGFADWAQLASATLSALLAVAGMVLIWRSRLLAYQLFQKSILISIFITQVFMFYQDQWNALAVLAVNLLILGLLNFAIEHESETAGRP